jgi:lysophospholipid acyltransferase (LPLAT)-like uncharacterized protein
VTSRANLKFALAGVVGAAFLRFLFSTIRIRVEGGEMLRTLRKEGQPFILVLWHGQILAPIHLHRGENITILVSEHADGEYIARVLQRLGLRTVRGSSTRGGTKGLRDLLRAARAGSSLAVTPDGPRGPRHVFKEGALVPARIHGLPVIPIGMAASRARVLGSWDRFVIPAPFSTVQVAYGSPVTIGRDADDRAMAEHARALEEEMVRLTSWCETRLGRPGAEGSDAAIR